MKYFRSLFTSGASYENHAIVYNTANGKTYYFEDITAELVKHIFATPREAEIDTASIAQQLEVEEAQITAFLGSELLSVGLVTDHVLTDEEWCEYHSNHPFDYKERMRDLKAIEKSYDEALPDSMKEVTSALLELTFACSERCIHCYNEGAARTDIAEENRLMPGQLKIEEYRNIIDQMVEHGVRQITISGGDPFSNPQCWEILEYLSKKNVLISVQTNGLALNTPEKIHRLAKMGINNFAVTLYSADADVHDSITRRPGSWRRTMDVMEQMAKWPIEIEIKCPVFAINARTYFPIHDVSRRINAKENFSVQLSPGADGDVSITEYLNMDDETLEMVFQDQYLKCGFRHSDEEYTDKDFSRNGIKCGARHNIIVNPVGNVGACSLVYGSMGNLRHQTLREVIDGQARYNSVKGPQSKMYANCGKEEYCKYCKHICVAGDRLRTDGSAYKPFGTICQLAQLQMKYEKAYAEGKKLMSADELREALAKMPKVEVPEFRKKIVD